MCKFDPKNDSRRIDPCMKIFIENLNFILKPNIKIVASCCGHKKYPMTIIIDNQDSDGKQVIDLVSRTVIPRTKKFYRKDKQGHYFIPEIRTLTR